MNPRDTLPIGTMVGDFEIRRLLGKGGFGMVYEAYEDALDRTVALKEYYLQEYSRREGLDVVPRDEAAAEMFNSGMARFLREARLLSMLNQRTRTEGSLVTVYRVFQANRTAFMCMKLYEGQTLRQAVMAAPERVTEAWLISVLLRMLEALHTLHSLPGENLVHRDVSPDNIIVQPDGVPVLLDFGATRKASDELTAMIYKPGYSPIEQYTDAYKQGPWTDLYALCGVAYFAICRETPKAAIDRYAGAPFASAAERGAGRFSSAFLAVVDHGLSLLPEARFQSAEQMREALLAAAGQGTAIAAATPPIEHTTAWPTTRAQEAPPDATLALTRETAHEPRPADDDDTTRVVPATQRQGPPTPLDLLTPGPATSPTPGPAPTPPPRPTPPPPPATPAPGPAPYAPKRPARGLWIGGGAVAAALAAGGLYLVLGPSKPTPPPPPPLEKKQPPDLASSGASSPEPNRQPPPPPPSPPPPLDCEPAKADWACVLTGLERLSAGTGGVAIQVAPKSVKLGQPLSLEITPSTDGTLRIWTVDDAPDAKLSLLFPNARDRNDQVRAGQAMRLPRDSNWRIIAQPPKGRSWMIAVLTPPGVAPPPLTPQSLASAARAIADGQAGKLFGLPDCGSTPQACVLSIKAADFEIR